MGKRYQRGNQKPYNKDQTMQWAKDIKGVIRSHSTKTRQCNEQKQENKKRNNDLQNISQKTTLGNINPTKNLGEIRMLQKSNQFLFH
jgi:hypothetical protein